MHMQTEDEILCLCARQRLSTAEYRHILHLSQTKDVDWQFLFKAAEIHHISPLVYHHLNQIGELSEIIPPVVRGQFKTAYIHNVIMKKGTRTVLSKCLSLYNAAGVEVMLVKGESLNQLVYDQPWYTISGDVDLILRTSPEKFFAGPYHYILDEIDTLNQAGRKFQEHIEYDFIVHHDISMNGVLKVGADDLWRTATPIELAGFPILVPRPEDMLLIAAINACRKRFFRLKALSDMAAVIDKFPELDWNAIVERAGQWQADTILYTALCLLQRTIGSSVPTWVAPELKVNRARQRLIEYIIDFLINHFSVSRAGFRSDLTLLGHSFSWSLLLTYATYRFDQIGHILWNAATSWRRTAWDY